MEDGQAQAGAELGAVDQVGECLHGAGHLAPVRVGLPGEE
jgi:hypothetical protein